MILQSTDVIFVCQQELLFLSFLFFKWGQSENLLTVLRFSHLRTVLRIALRAVGLCIEIQRFN
jgi:hypothetical protein